MAITQKLPFQAVVVCKAARHCAVVKLVYRKRPFLFKLLIPHIHTQAHTDTHLPTYLCNFSFLPVTSVLTVPPSSLLSLGVLPGCLPDG